MKGTVLVVVGVVLAGAACAPRPGREHAPSPGSSIAPRQDAPAQQDTSRPPMPTESNLPLDTTITVYRSGDTGFLYFRNFVGIVFDDTTGGATIRAVLRKYRGVIIGGAPDVGTFGAYIVEVPDPGPTFGAVDSLVNRIAVESGVDWVCMVTSREPIGRR